MSSTRRISAIAIGLLAVLLSNRVTYSQSFFDDFEDNNLTDGLPIKWDLDTNGTISAENGDMVIAPIGICCASPSQDATDLFPHTDVIIDATFQFPTNSNSFVGVGFRDALDGINSQYWVGGFSTGEIGLGYTTNGNIVITKRGVYLPTGPVLDNADVTFHVEAIGNAITFSAWETLAGPEQAATVQWTDPLNRLPEGNIVYPFINPNGSREPLRVRSFGATAIPEPAGATLAAIAGLCLAGLRRRF